MSPKTVSHPSITVHPKDVHATIGKHMLADGEHLIIDLAGSHGPYLRDEATGHEYLDFYAYFASMPIGHNHPKLREPWFVERLAEAALHNPANADVYTTYMAEFVETFARIARPADMPHLFFITGGALAVENALKAAFDWKVRKNLAAGKGEKGSQIIHFSRSVPRPQRLHPLVDQHRRPAQVPVLSKIRLAAHHQPEAALPHHRPGVGRGKRCRKTGDRLDFMAAELTRCRQHIHLSCQKQSPPPYPYCRRYTGSICLGNISAECPGKTTPDINIIADNTQTIFLQFFIYISPSGKENRPQRQP